MAGRVTRSSSILGVSSPCIGKPIKVSKRRKAKIFSDAEKKEIAKHEIQAGQFRYRLRSVRDILKNFNSENTNEKGSSTQKRRKSKLHGNKRRSIAETVMLKNLQKDANNDDKQEKETCFVDKKEKEYQEGEQEDLEEEQSRDTEYKEEMMEKQENDNITEVTVHENTSKVNMENDQVEKEEKCKLSEVSESISPTPDKQTEKDVAKRLQVKNKVLLPKETEEEAAARVEMELKLREEAIEKIKMMKKEQEEWISLYESYQKRLSDAKSDQANESTSGLNRAHFSEEQRKFLEGSVNPEELLDRLKGYQTDLIGCARYVQIFTERMQDFKKNITEYLSSLPSALTPEKDGSSRTPRTLITNIMDRAKDIESKSDQSFI